MIIQKIETWWVRRNKCLFDDKRKGKSAMDWDVMVLKLTTDTGIEGIATCGSWPISLRQGKNMA